MRHPECLVTRQSGLDLTVNPCCSSDIRINGVTAAPSGAIDTNPEGPLGECRSIPSRLGVPARNHWKS
jgi:hypothetical protein